MLRARDKLCWQQMQQGTQQAGKPLHGKGGWRGVGACKHTWLFRPSLPVKVRALVEGRLVDNVGRTA